MSVDQRAQDPSGERFNAIVQAVLFSLVGCIVGFVAAGLLAGMNNPQGWALIVLGACAGVIPLVRWQRNRSGAGAVDLHDIDRSLQPMLLDAASATQRIEHAATAAPEGAVSELLAENHRSALAHLRLLERDARSAGLNAKPEMIRVCHQLDELAATSEQLLRTTLEAQPTVLNTLAERTALVNETLANAEDEPWSIDQANRLSAGSDGRDPEDRDATNDR